MIQTYAPDHFAVTAAAEQDYGLFYRQELLYRKMMGYPPVMKILSVMLSSADEAELCFAADSFNREIRRQYALDGVLIIGPVEASPYKLNDIYRKILYIKNESYDILLKIRKSAQKLEEEQEIYKNISFQYDG